MSGRTARRDDAIISRIHRIQNAVNDLARSFTAVAFNHPIWKPDEIDWKNYGYDGPVSAEKWNADYMRYRHEELTKHIELLNEDLRHEGIIE